MQAFDYQTPKTVADAVKAAGAEDAKLLAGGQSLLASMKLGLAAPSALVDLGGIAELKGIKVDAGKVVIGAMTTHAAVASSKEVREALPALAALAESIGDRQVRNRGTLGGSLANNDPAADYPAAVLALGATVQTDRRSIAADDFFKGLYETALAEGEVITSVSFPVPEKAAYQKFRQPASRFAHRGRVRQQGRAGRARGGDGRRAQRVPREGAGGQARCQMGARVLRRREGRAPRGSTATCTARPSTARR